MLLKVFAFGTANLVIIKKKHVGKDVFFVSYKEVLISKPI